MDDFVDSMLLPAYVVEDDAEAKAEQDAKPEEWVFMSLSLDEDSTDPSKLQDPHDPVVRAKRVLQPCHPQPAQRDRLQDRTS